MADLWYYGRGPEIFGPLSSTQLAGLAAAGDVRVTDTVWKDGVEAGVPAGKVRHLFPAAAAATAPLPAPPAPPAPPPPMPGLPPARRARATAGKGAVIVGQDGTTVKFRKKCTTCGHEDSSWKTIPITRGVTRSRYYCPKCRRNRDVEVHGYIS
jgi:hypothetical protein